MEMTNNDWKKELTSPADCLTIKKHAIIKLPNTVS